ncbi:MAG TPA: 2-amino-4-hydroxy-6-hydroxymethyldihydropteridine diphosphokinase, partial [Rheinheimera sp.]
MANTLVYIGLGANLAQPVQQLERAVVALQSIKDTELVQVSSFYGSKPMG